MMGFCPHPDSVWANENYLVCRKTVAGDEHIVQSESTPEKAEHSVDVLNEHESMNARTPNYYWRKRKQGEIPNGEKHYLT